ncbi:MAG: efflux RND transporter permease subunit [Deltaproteobacteria bacterium]|jgi:cobalt-zinc-cadmium resistance protein CzcA|nr:efflux RND transporter permease subunit [Deltaproteobacteria bacterium]MBW2533243.1 efflux RND transporter permease subunit [Deltaproteobacteria bacterium]
MSALLETILRHRMAVAVVALCFVIGGALAFRRVPIDAFPDVTNQQVMILTEGKGLGPVEVEQQITFPIEWVMGGLPDVKLVRSMSKTGLSQVVIVFEDDVDTYFARQLVFERLQLAAEQLPPGVEPEMGPISTGLGEILQYTIESDRHDLTERRTMQDWQVAPRLRMIPGVNEVNSFGGLVRQIHVLVDPNKLLKYRLTLPEVVQALSENNANAGGSFIVKEWEQENIRSVGLFGSIQDVQDVVLEAEDGTPVYLADVADVVEGAMTRLGAVTRDGRGEVAAGMVIMLKGENSKEVVERVKAALPEIERSLPEGASIDVFYDRTELVEAVITTVTSALAQGGLFVVMILFLVIGRLRAAVVVATSLPMTALIAFILMDAADVTANLMSLGGMAIALGMVVDGSIVVTENVIRHLRERSETSRLDVVIDATREVARPIAFSTLIIVLVFVPLLTLEGIEGRMFEPLALTMVFAMMGSLVVALTVVPVALSFMRQSARDAREPRLFVWLQRRYLLLLTRVLRRRKLTVGVAGIVFAATLTLTPLIGTEFLPPLEEGAIAINAVRLPNASLPGSVAVGTFMEKELAAFPEVKTVVTKTGRAEISEDPMGPEQSDLLIALHPESEWATGRSKAELVEAMKTKLGAVPGLRFSFSQPIALRVNELISGVRSDLAVKVFGPDLDVLKERADRIAAILGAIDGAEDVRVEQVTGFTQLDITPDRRAMARHKLNVSDLNEVVAAAIGGKVATTMIDGQKRFGVLVRFPEELRNDVETVEAILLPTPSGGRVPLRDVAAVERTEGPSQISHESNMRRVVVEANIRRRDLGGFVAEAQQRLEQLEHELPEGYWLDYGGTFENQQRAMARLAIVVPLSVLLIFFMLLSALRSPKTAGLVLANLPFALVGGVLAMLLFRITLNVPSTVGFIALFGVAVQNGTVLVTFVNQLRQAGRPAPEAVLEACALRFRALLMTAATTVLGLLPMVYALGPGAEVQRPLAVVVMGGLVSATMLTLFVLPALYLWLPPKLAPALPASAANAADVGDRSRAQAPPPARQGA